MYDRDIIQLAETLAARFVRDPFQLAEAEEVTVSFCDLGSQPGAYYIVRGYPILLLNEHLSPRRTEMVCAHEMGHHLLHRDILCRRQDVKNPPPIGEETVRQTEREANLFAASFLLPDEAVASVGGTAAEAAERLGLPEEFLEMKAAAMRVMGKNPAAAEPDPCFLRYAAAVG